MEKNYPTRNFGNPKWREIVFLDIKAPNFRSKNFGFSFIRYFSCLENNPMIKASYLQTFDSKFGV